MVDQVSDVEKHLAGIDSAELISSSSGLNMRCIWTETALAFVCRSRCRVALSRKLDQIFFAHAVHWNRNALFTATVVQKDLEVHLRLTAQTLDIGKKLPLIGANRFSKGFVVCKNSAKAERKDRG